MSRVNVYYCGNYHGTGIDGAAMAAGANVVSTVDRCNSDGTGVACIDVEDVATLTDLLDEADGVDSYDVR